MILIVHGGAGNRKPSGIALKKLSEAVSSGFEILNKDGCALDAVIKAIAVLENSGIFNAGSGGNLQLDGVRRLDASLMEGKNLKAGSVIGLEGIRNPVMAARIVMDSPHVILTNIGAKKISEKSLAPLPEPDEKLLKRLEMIKKKEKEIVRVYDKYFSTVGAVALDKKGNLAAGASTGGIKAMLPGRVGDTPIIGAGVYADNKAGAVSCTGKGEDIIRLSLAKEITTSLKSMPPLKAARVSLRRLSEIKGEAGVIVVNKKAQFAIMHTTEYMISGYADRKGVVVRENFNRVYL